MICQSCGSIMLPVYSVIDGYRWICTKCFFELAVSGGFDKETGSTVNLAMIQYQEGNYEDAERRFLMIAGEQNEPEIKMACYWHALLSRYGVSYTSYGETYIVNLWRFSLPDKCPNQSESWRRLLELIVTTGYQETVLPQMNILHAEVAALERRASPCKVYVNWDVRNGNDDVIPSLAQGVVNKLMVADLTVPCFLPQMHENSLQNYSASVHFAMQTAEMMLVIVGNEGIRENSNFDAEIAAFWRKNNMVCERIVVCAPRLANIEELLPRWMHQYNWSIQWVFDETEPIDAQAEDIAGKVRIKLDSLSQRFIEQNSIPSAEDADALYRRIREFIKSNVGNMTVEVFDGYDEAVRIWRTCRDVRFGVLLLRFHTWRKDANKVREYYNQLQGIDNPLVNKTLNDPAVIAFL